MNQSAYYLRDIRGLDAVSWWPPGPGWWLALGLTAVVLLAAMWYAGRRRQVRGPWRGDARRRLRSLRRRLGREQPRPIVDELSELMRRIAIARCGRRDCAGIAGPEWLEWLHENDPSGFDWCARGRLLVELPYAPPEIGADPAQVRELINAALRWLSGAKPTSHTQPSQIADEAETPTTGNRVLADV